MLVRWTSSRWADWDTSGSDDTQTMCSHTSDRVLHYRGRKNRSNNTENVYETLSGGNVDMETEKQAWVNLLLPDSCYWGAIFDFAEKTNIFPLQIIQLFRVCWDLLHLGVGGGQKGQSFPLTLGSSFSLVLFMKRLPPHHGGEFNLCCLQHWIKEQYLLQKQQKMPSTFPRSKVILTAYFLDNLTAAAVLIYPPWPQQNEKPLYFMICTRNRKVFTSCFVIAGEGTGEESDTLLMWYIIYRSLF